MTRFFGVAIVTGLLAFSAPLTGADDKPAAAPAAAAQQARNIDVAICLDVSGSMQGLIQSAKNKLWDIVNELARIKPAPNLRVALYSYGHSSYDRNAGWVKKDLDLTTDLDALYQKLFALTINGGEEYVARVTRDAVEQQKWSADKSALKIIFVAGNEPADQDPQVTLKSVADKAVAGNIIINTIYCGPANSGEAAGWRDYAVLAKGTAFNIDQNGGTVVINTPFDKELAELSNKLSTTYVCYGVNGKAMAQNQQAQDANAYNLNLAAAASRANTKANGLYNCWTWDLVDRMKNDPKFDIKKVPVEELSEELKKMKPEEREAFVKKKAAERDQMQKQINELSAKRQTYINEEMKKNPSKGDQAFDAAVRGALRQQAQSRGITIPE